MLLLEEEMSKVPLTVTGAEKLREELHRLKTVDRPSVVAAIAEARSHGDLSENAEYDAAKERQGFIEGRIQEVEGKLSNEKFVANAKPEVVEAERERRAELEQQLASLAVALARVSEAG